MNSDRVCSYTKDCFIDLGKIQDHITGLVLHYALFSKIIICILNICFIDLDKIQDHIPSLNLQYALFF